MDFIVKYWAQLIALVGLVAAFTTLKVGVAVLKEKVRTLFGLHNKEKQMNYQIGATLLINNKEWRVAEYRMGRGRE